MNGVKLEVGTEGSLLAHETILELEQQDEFVSYAQDSESMYELTLHINCELYEELGEPKEITVRVRPGDKLNDPS